MDGNGWRLAFGNFVRLAQMFLGPSVDIRHGLHTMDDIWNRKVCEEAEAVQQRVDSGHQGFAVGGYTGRFGAGGNVYLERLFG